MYCNTLEEGEIPRQMRKIKYYNSHIIIIHFKSESERTGADFQEIWNKVHCF